MNNRRSAAFLLVFMFFVVLATTAAADEERAKADFKKAVETINAGKDALRAGDNAKAYCLFAEASLRMNGIKEHYPSWNPKAVEKQIAAVEKLQGNVKATTCKILDGMKEDQFRFDTWQRQVLMLDRLDKIIDMLTYITREQDRNQEYIKDIRDRMSDIEAR